MTPEIPPDGILSNPDGNLVDNETAWISGTGQLIGNIHPRSACEGRPCVIHDPSDHPMRPFPTHFRGGYPDPGEIKPAHMERICPHGVGHPDPDDLAYQESIGVESMGVHGCDGCCLGTGSGHTSSLAGRNRDAQDPGAGS